MESPKKNPDSMNTIGIITVGAVGSALVYLSIVGLQAFYVDETAIVDEVSTFGQQENVRADLKSRQVGVITTDLMRKGWTTPAPDNKQVVSIPIETAKQLVVRDAKVDPANLVPAVGRSETGTIQPIFGRPVALPPPPPPDVLPPADGTVPGVVPPDGASPAGAVDPTQPTPPGATPPATPGPSVPTTPSATTPPAAAPATTPPAPAAGGQP